jgi:glyceraldehyde 3-phosphate dehydrogenase
MKTKIAINGFGRIGRSAFKIAHTRSDLEVVAINDLADAKTLAHLLKHDSNYGDYNENVTSGEQNIVVGDQKIKVLNESNPADLPWKDLGVEIVVECTGQFTDVATAHGHIDAGAKRVVLAAAVEDDGANTIIMGVNEDKLSEAGEIISGASCTASCVAPVAAVIEDNFGIEKAMMTAVHSYTSSQRVLDASNKDLRQARSAATNIIPTTTGASISVAKAIPALEGAFDGLSVRVPVPLVSLCDLTIVLKSQATTQAVNEVFKKAAADPYYQGILAVTEEPLVSSDFIGNASSAVVDLALTKVVGGNLLRVVAWYDNEWGYCNRLVELVADTAKLLQGDDSTEVSDDQPEMHKEPQKEEKHPIKIKDESESLLEPPDSADEELLPEPGKTEQ